MAGTVFKYRDNVDTDVILPARYLALSSREDLAAHCLEDLDGEFVKRVQPGDFIVAGENFGCGSSREHAPIAILSSGVRCESRPPLPGFFTATPSTSACPFWSVRRRWPRCGPATSWRWTWPPEQSKI